MSPAGKDRTLGSTASPLTGVLAGRRLRLPGELTRQIDQVTGPLRWVR
ncbi:MAG TPA: hypothetical protein VHS32_07360 [Streptosporangiaceae bacterium]|jgi:hypothetical protein|nr:hypothetical protein [Streptosporangiaceae bacterium]